MQIGNLPITFYSVRCILKNRVSGMLNEKVLDLFIDPINLHNGFELNKLPSNPSIFAINVFRIIQLFKCAECSSNKLYNLKLDDQNFKMKLKTILVKV